MGFSRKEYWSGLPRPSPRTLPHSRSEPASPTVPALQADSLPLSYQGRSPISGLELLKLAWVSGFPGGLADTQISGPHSQRLNTSGAAWGSALWVKISSGVDAATRLPVRTTGQPGVEYEWLKFIFQCPCSFIALFCPISKPWNISSVFKLLTIPGWSQNC